MRISLIIVLCLIIAVVNSTAPKTNRRTSKAPAPKSAYAYLRSVRGTRTCLGDALCPFWERHSRSFAALRCYAKEYRECACLHRMCFSSCMFTPEVCNKEMAHCLKQICPRCSSADAAQMCSIYDSVADRVATALSAFACYPCCPPQPNSATNQTTTTGTLTVTTAKPANNAQMTTGAANVPAGNGNRPNAATNLQTPNGNGQIPPGAGRPPVVPGQAASGNAPVPAGNMPAPAGNAPVPAGNAPVANINGQNNGNRRPANGNQGIVPPNVLNPQGGLPANIPNLAIQNQRVKPVVRPGTLRVVTTRRVKTTKRRRATATPLRNKNKAVTRTTAKMQRKPQANTRPKN